MIQRVLKWSAPREQPASTASPAAAVPNSPPMPDLSALTAEEIRTLEAVLERQEELEQLEEQREKKLKKMIEEFETNVRHLEQSAATPRGLGCVPVIDLRLCRLCFKTKFADGIGKLCVDCKRRVCSRCGTFCRIVAEMTTGRERWHCNLCQLKRQLLCMTGRWYHGTVNRPAVSVRELLTRIRDVKELDIESDKEEGASRRANGGRTRLRDIKTDSEDIGELRPKTIAKRKNRSSHRCLQRSVAITDDPEPPTREQIVMERHDSLRELRAKRRSKSDLSKSPTLARDDNQAEFYPAVSKESLTARAFSEIGGDVMLLTSSLNDDLQDIGHSLDSPTSVRLDRRKIGMVGMHIQSESTQSLPRIAVDRYNTKRPRGPVRYPTISCEEDIYRTGAHAPPPIFLCRTASIDQPARPPPGTAWRRDAKSDTCRPSELQDLHPPGSFEVTLFNDRRTEELRMRDFTAANFGLQVTGGVKTENGRLAAYVTDVREGGPADKADVRPGYTVLLWNGFPLTDLTFEQTKRVIDATRDENHVTLTMTCPGLSPFGSQSMPRSYREQGSGSRSHLTAPPMAMGARASAESCPNVRGGSLYQSNLTKGDTRSWPLRLPVEPQYLHNSPSSSGEVSGQRQHMRKSSYSSATGVTIMVPSDVRVDSPADRVDNRADKGELPTSRSKESLRRSPSPSSQEMWMQRKQERLASRRVRTTSDVTRPEGRDSLGGTGRRRCNTVPSGSHLLSGLDYESPSSRKRAGSSSSFVSSLGSEMSLSSLLPSDGDSDGELAAPEDTTGGPAQVMWTTKEAADTSLGYVNLSLLMSKGNMEVSILCARGIGGKAETTLPDTYVKTYLLEEGRKLQKRKTKVVHQSSDPNYQKKLLYPACDVDNRVLQLMIWKKGKGLDSNKCVGEIRVELDRLDLSQKTSGWYKLLPPMAGDTGSVESLTMGSH
ncbi:regulating synaptic membrane exocytosis protein 2-like isoform X1 [Branchiostoma lanceolatum]|uniref:regulating synaptic membrane exocytosis protein 2-like isoform X1 n=1 Tax=Branchiostoma lanceolatum TaxID=7740 RepID=UPI00345248D8